MLLSVIGGPGGWALGHLKHRYGAWGYDSLGRVRHLLLVRPNTGPGLQSWIISRAHAMSARALSEGCLAVALRISTPSPGHLIPCSLISRIARRLGHSLAFRRVAQKFLWNVHGCFRDAWKPKRGIIDI